MARTLPPALPAGGQSDDDGPTTADGIADADLAAVLARMERQMDEIASCVDEIAEGMIPDEDGDVLYADAARRKDARLLRRWSVDQIVATLPHRPQALPAADIVREAAVLERYIENGAPSDPPASLPALAIAK